METSVTEAQFIMGYLANAVAPDWWPYAVLSQRTNGPYMKAHP
jgi:hypothetical protein